MATIELRNVSKTYASEAKKRGLLPLFVHSGSGTAKHPAPAVDNLNLVIFESKITVILGPSGCGKTTLIRVIAGLSKPDSGEVFYDGVNLNEIPMAQRCIGMVFQSYALYPHYTAKENILTYYLFKKKIPRFQELVREKLERTSKLLDVDIEYLYDKKPDKLSGAEQQRVAMGRCITRNPRPVWIGFETYHLFDKEHEQRLRTEMQVY